MSNRLARETSPYLLQHQNNPVDWYPWGEEALQRARRENKPILLSIGYSACHWCHVMEHESFENETIAQLMNENFVNIKVDREERPDLDQIYQNVAQAMTRSGGWPLTVFLTPDLRPFFGGTYFPPEDRYGRPGFPRVVQALAEAYREQPEAVHENAGKLTDYIRALEQLPAAEGEWPTLADLDDCAEGLLGHLDLVQGGLAGAPKFPQAMLLSFLWRLGGVRGRSDYQDAVIQSLRKMAEGGIYDQLGGGFHRYSVDETWSVPHFEKMLYDNGLLLRLYSEVLLTAPESALDIDTRQLFTDVLRDTVQYIEREMTSSDGMFYASQDADSEGEEGKFFVWDLADLKPVLTEKEAQVIALRFGITDAGNFEHGKTVLFQARPITEVAKTTGCSESETVRLLQSAKAKLLDARAKRVAPGTDRKVIASWNGLMISGLAWASKVLANENGRQPLPNQVATMAWRAFEQLSKKLTVPDSEARLFSTYHSGIAKHPAYLDDYAFLAQAALDLLQVEGDPEKQKWLLNRCEQWLAVIHRHFRDSNGLGYFFTSDDHEELIQRPKSIYDQAIPSGIAACLRAWIALTEISDSERSIDARREVEEQLPKLFTLVKRSPLGSGEFLNAALLFTLGPVALSGAQAIDHCVHPHCYVKPLTAKSAGQSDALMLCHRGTCSLVPTDVAPQKIREVLGSA